MHETEFINNTSSSGKIDDYEELLVKVDSLNDSVVVPHNRRSTVILKHSVSATEDDKKETIKAFRDFNPKSDRVDDMIIHRVLAIEELEIKEDDIDSASTPEDLVKWLKIKQQSRMSLQPGRGQAFTLPSEKMMKSHEPYVIEEESFD